MSGPVPPEARGSLPLLTPTGIFTKIKTKKGGGDGRQRELCKSACRILIKTKIRESSNFSDPPHPTIK